MAISNEILKSANTKRWHDCHLTRSTELTTTARKLLAPEIVSRYREVEGSTGVPWFVVAVIHVRESSQRWDASLAQGDPWNKKSIHVPRGRGPFRSWEEAAFDALENCPPFAGHNEDWSIGGTLAMLEKYNGLGYATRGLPSPYIWSGTDQYKRGKFIRDGVFSATTVDKQLGCAGLLIAMASLGAAINFSA